MPEITVTQLTDTQFRVRVTEGQSETVPEVTLTDTDLQPYTYCMPSNDSASVLSYQ
jgi:hypothetical protein